MLDNLQHIFFDISLMFRWLWEIFKEIFDALITWPTSLYRFFVDTLAIITAPHTFSTPIVFLDSVSTILNAIPYWSTICIIVAGGFVVALGMEIFHILKS